MSKDASKEQAAKEAGYSCWQHLIFDYCEHRSEFPDEHVNRAMDIYLETNKVLTDKSKQK